MTVSMGSNKKRSGGGVVVWCVVLGLAMLVDAVAARGNPLPPLTDCATFCHNDPYHDRCLYICLRLGAHGRVREEEEARGGGGGVGLLAEGEGREEEAKRKQGGTAVHLPGWYCEERCHGKQDYIYCLRRCMASPSSGAALRLASHRGTGEEETRGGGGVGLQAEGAGREEGKKKQEEDAPVQLDHSSEFCSFMCHYVHDNVDCLRQCEMGEKGGEARGGGVGLLAEVAGREEEEKRKQGDMVVHPPWSCELECEDIVDPDFDHDSYMACVCDCYKGFGNAVRRRGAEGEEARGGGGAVGLLTIPAERAGREEEEEGKRKQEDYAVHLTYDRAAYCYDLCIGMKGLEFPKCMKSCVDKVN